MNTVRTVWMGEAAQVGFAFLAGLAMCTWGVCYLPAIARLTTEGNRASAFGLIFSVSIGTSALGGVVCGYLPQWLRMAGFAMQGAEVKRLILQVSCGIALVGLIAVLRLRIPPQTAPDGAGGDPAVGPKLVRWMETPSVLATIFTVDGALVGDTGGLHSVCQCLLGARSTHSIRADRPNLLDPLSWSSYALGC